MKNKKNRNYRSLRSSRRKAVKTIGKTALLVGAANFLPMPWVRKVDAGETILIGVPSSLSTPYGVADDQDHLNGSIMAMEEWNSKGGVQGREIKLFVPDYDKLSPESSLYRFLAKAQLGVKAISFALSNEARSSELVSKLSSYRTTGS